MAFDGGRLRGAAREIRRERDDIRRLAEAVATPSDQNCLVDALSAHIERIIDHAGRLAAWRDIVSADGAAPGSDGDVFRISVEEIKASGRQIADVLEVFRGARPIPAHAGAAEIFDESLVVIQGIIETLDHRESALPTSRLAESRRLDRGESR